MNELHQRFILNVRSVSKNIDDYLTEERFIGDVVNEDVLTDEVIFNLVFNLVETELSELGLIIDTIEDKYGDVDVIKAVMFMRTVFAIENFLPKMETNTELRDVLDSLLTCTDYDEESLIVEVTSILNDMYPLNPVFNFLCSHAEYFVSNTRFKEHLSHLIELGVSASLTSESKDEEYTHTVVAYVNRIRDRFTESGSTEVGVDTIQELLFRDVPKEFRSLINNNIGLLYDIDSRDFKASQRKAGIGLYALANGKLDFINNLEDKYKPTINDSVNLELLVMTLGDHVTENFDENDSKLVEFMKQLNIEHFMQEKIINLIKAKWGSK